MKLDTDLLLVRARRLRDEVLLPSANTLDQSGYIPIEILERLAAEGQLALTIPRNMNGYDCNLREFASCIAVLAEGCLSTAFVLAMHSHMTAVLRDFGRPDQRQSVFSDVTKNRALVASVTSEYGREANLLRATSPLKHANGKLMLERRSPNVSYGEIASYFLITMRTCEDASADSVQLVLMHRNDGEVKTTGDWRGSGMRATGSIPMEFKASLAKEQIIEAQFNKIAWHSIIPWGYVGWAACWYGAAFGCYRRVVNGIRIGRVRPGSEALATWTPLIARARLLIQTLESSIEATISAVESSQNFQGPTAERKTQIVLNNLKISAAEWAPDIVDCLSRVCGLASYMQEDEFGLERTIRDLRSAPLLYSNETLLQANGVLALLERHE